MNMRDPLSYLTICWKNIHVMAITALWITYSASFMSFSEPIDIHLPIEEWVEEKIHEDQYQDEEGNWYWIG